MACEDVLADVHAEVNFLRPNIVLQLAADWQKPRVVAPDDLVLQEPLLERVGLLVGAVVLLQHLQQPRIDVILIRIVHVLGLQLYYYMGVQTAKDEQLAPP